MRLKLAGPPHGTTTRDADHDRTRKIFAPALPYFTDLAGRNPTYTLLYPGTLLPLAADRA